MLRRWGAACELALMLLGSKGSNTIRSYHSNQQVRPSCRVTITSPQQTILSIRSPSHLTVPSRSHRIRILTDGFGSQERVSVYTYIYIYMGMGMRIGNMHKLPPSPAGLTFLSKFVLLSSLAPMARYPSITTHSFDILIPFVARHGPSDAPEPLFTSVLCGCCCLRRCRQFLIYGEKKLGKAWQHAEFASTALCARYATECNGMDV